MKILSVMQFIPRADGMGGEQRAWFLLNALARLGDVDLVVVQPTAPASASAVDLSALRAVASSVAIHRLPELARLSDLVPLVPRRLGGWVDYLRMGTPHTPRLPAAALRRLVDPLSTRSFDLAFAGRLPAALMIDALRGLRLIDIRRRIADFDDILSEFFSRERATISWTKPDRRLAKSIDVALIRRSEARVMATWDGVGVCSEDDVARLQVAAPKTLVRAIPNVVDRPLLPPPAEGGSRLLFVGNLSFGPNVQGLQRFVDEAWPKVRQAVPGARLQVVGLNPTDDLRAKLVAAGADLAANVPSVEPFYRDADVVIAPIFFGGGTRIKILEAMAYGRPVVATSIGAEGLALDPGRSVMIADSMDDFADAAIRLLGNAALRVEMARHARAHQQQTFGPPAMAASFRAWVEAAGGAAPHPASV